MTAHKEALPPGSSRVPLWRNLDFQKLWLGQTISEMGSRITRDGLPLLAVINLGATPFQMGILNAIAGLPVLLFSLFAGVWVDRLRRRPLMIAADLGRALLLLTIPLAYLNGWLGMAQLYVIVALTGVLTVLFSVAYRAYLPSLVEQENIVEGNAKLSISDSIAEVAGPGLAGVLVQVLTAPIAIFFDALSFLMSVVSMALIRKPEALPRAQEERQHIAVEAAEGMRAVLKQPVLRALAGAAATGSFFGNFIGVLYGLYAIRTLNISPAALGFTVAAGGVGSLLGALFAQRVERRFGIGTTLIGALLLGWCAALLIPLAAAFPKLALPLLVIAQLGDTLDTIYFINAISLRQSITPGHVLGRVNASMELLAGGVGPLGALVGGALAGLIEVQATLYVAAIGGALSVAWLLMSPIRGLKSINDLFRQ